MLIQACALTVTLVSPLLVTVFLTFKCVYLIVNMTGYSDTPLIVTVLAILKSVNVSR